MSSGLTPDGSKLEPRKLVPPFCEIPGCGYSLDYQKHRIFPGREGGTYRFGNAISLCPNHHQRADRGDIPAKDLYAVVRLRVETYYREGRVTKRIYEEAIEYIDLHE